MDDDIYMGDYYVGKDVMKSQQRDFEAAIKDVPVSDKWIAEATPFEFAWHCFEAMPTGQKFGVVAGGAVGALFLLALISII